MIDRLKRIAPIAALVLLGACASNKPEAEKYTPEEISKDPDVPLPIVISRLDFLLRQWNEAKVGPPTTRNLGLLRNLTIELATVGKQRLTDLKRSLETSTVIRHRQIIAAAIGFTRDREVLNPLLIALNDPDPVVRENALLGLAQLADENTPVDAVADKLRPEESVQSQVNAGLCLMRLADAGARMDRALPTLRLALRSNNDAVKTHAAYALGAAKDAQSVDALIELLRCPRALVAAAAANALGKVGDAKAGPALVEGLGSPENAIREESHRGLRRIAGEDLGTEPGPWKRWLSRIQGDPERRTASQPASAPAAR